MKCRQAIRKNGGMKPRAVAAVLVLKFSKRSAAHCEPVCLFNLSSVYKWLDSRAGLNFLTAGPGTARGLELLDSDTDTLSVTSVT